MPARHHPFRVARARIQQRPRIDLRQPLDHKLRQPGQFVIGNASRVSQNICASCWPGRTDMRAIRRS
jgi:hypothetical protein